MPGFACTILISSLSWRVPTSTFWTYWPPSVVPPYITVASRSCATSASVSCSIRAHRGSSAAGYTLSSSSAVRTTVDASAYFSSSSGNPVTIAPASRTAICFAFALNPAIDAFSASTESERVTPLESTVMSEHPIVFFMSCTRRTGRFSAKASFV